MSGIKGQPKKGTQFMCVSNGCLNVAKYRGLGLCSAHRNRILRESKSNTAIVKRIPAVGVCFSDDCTSGVFAKNLCKQCYMQVWAKENPHKICAMASKRRASIKKRTPNWLTDDDLWMIEEAYDLAQKRTKLLGFAWHVDHIIPLHGKNVCGLHVPSNLQVIPAISNQRKSSSFVI
jgi:hypothetical protein